MFSHNTILNFSVMDQITDYSDEKMVALFTEKAAQLFVDAAKDALAGKIPKNIVIMN